VVSEDATIDSRVETAWAVLAKVPDPEVPAVSLCDLGIVRDVREVSEAEGGGLHVVLTPTYSGCPATEVIAASVADALHAANLGPVKIEHRLAPAWTTDWISAEGGRKLRDYGIAPPSGMASAGHADGAAVAIRIRPRAVECPRCGSLQTERLSAFGSTACKALHRCLACREPFEHFKPI
jgi:ring-1,2-phenylacetyl-CoA epoxidase subunit PaaD